MATVPRFHGRMHAGQVLAELLADHHADIVLAIPNGGVPVAVPVAGRLGVSLGIAEVAPESARDTAAPMGDRHRERMRERDAGDVRNTSLAGPPAGTPGDRSAMVEAESRAAHALRADLPEVEGKRVVLVGDGLMDGDLVIAAARAIRCRGAARLVYAAPVVEESLMDHLDDYAHEVVAVARSGDASVPAEWYSDSSEVGNDEVRDLLEGVSAVRAWTVRPPIEAAQG